MKRRGKKHIAERIAIFLLASTALFLSTPCKAASVDIQRKSDVESQESLLEKTDETEVPVSTEPLPTGDFETTKATGILTASTSVEDAIPAIELDLGDFIEIMRPGEKQLLYVTVLPMDATNHNVTYDSSDTSVATINSIGRITARAVGKCRITISCGEVSDYFILTVAEKEQESLISVESIEIADMENELEVEKTLTIQATVFPTNASDVEISYISSNPQVATVSRTGEVKGVSKGRVSITVSAGGVSRQIKLSVVVKATEIRLEKSFFVLRPGDRQRVGAEVFPKEASRELSYKSSDESVFTVDESGNIEAVATGEATLIVKNDDTAAAASVIVNSGNAVAETAESTGQADGIPQQWEDIVYVKDIREIKEDRLKELYQKKSQLCVIGEGYSFLVNGSEIQNYHNLLKTEINLTQNEEGVKFSLNEGNHLPGPIHLQINAEPKGQLFLFNEKKQAYELIKTEDLKDITLSSPGRYIISVNNLAKDNGKVWTILLAGSGTAVLGCAAYIVVRKKYWFW